MENFKCKSIRLCRYLYSLGFNKISKKDEFNNEYPDFEFDIRKGNQPVYSFIVGVE